MHMCNKYIIDRIEGVIAVCESDDGVMTNIKCDNIKGKVREGAVIIEKHENSFYVDEDSTSERKMKIEKLMEGMWDNEK